MIVEPSVLFLCFWKTPRKQIRPGQKIVKPDPCHSGGRGQRSEVRGQRFESSRAGHYFKGLRENAGFFLVCPVLKYVVIWRIRDGQRYSHP